MREGARQGGVREDAMSDGHAAVSQTGARECPACDEPAAGNYFVSTYPPFSVWSARHVPRVESALAARPTDADADLGLYVHVPFCAKRCPYCYYLSFEDKSAEQMDAYLDALLREANLYANQPALAGRPLSFVYFGGGTPSLLPAGALRRLLSGLRQALAWTNVREATFECAPRSVTPRKLEALRDAGVTRISLGVQQLDDHVLRASGRVHLVADVQRAWDDIRACGFPIVNIDLMVGMQGETDASFDASLERVIAMGPESVTLYQLEIPPNTPLFRQWRCGEAGDAPADWPTKRVRLKRAFSRLERAGYTIRSAYAAVRDPRRHAFLYQDAQYRGADLIGIGLSSFSYFAGIHYQNATSFQSYIGQVEGGALPVQRAHVLSDEERLVREFILALKLGRADAARFRSRFGVDIGSRFAEPLARLQREGWLTLTHGDVTLTRAGLLRADRLLPAFYAPEYRSIRYS